MHLLFDENIPYKLAEGLNIIEQGNFKSAVHFEISHPRALNTEGASDEEVIATAGMLNAVIVSFDKDFKHHKHYYQLYKQHNVGVIFFKQPKKSTYWDMVQMFIRNWEKLKIELATVKAPFIFEINHQGIHRRDF